MWFYLESADLAPLLFLLRQMQAQAPHRQALPLHPRLVNDLIATIHKIQAQTAHEKGNPGQTIGELRAANVFLNAVVVILLGFIAYREIS